jgi:HEAT repeat protein
MKSKIILCLTLFVVMPFGHILGGTALSDSQIRWEADRLVEQMRGFSMQEPGGTSNGKIDPEEQRREDIVAKLRLLGKEAVPALARALNDPDVQMRRNAVLVLSDLSGTWEGKPTVDIRAAIPALIKATGDKDSDVRGWAAQALGTIGPDAKEAVPTLIRLLEDGDEGARNSSCIALGEIGPVAKSALPALHEALNDPSKDVRGFAQRAIEKIQNE